MASITFRPTIDEFEKYHEEFIENFTRKFQEEKYCIVYEKGNSDDYNHLQIYLGKQYSDNKGLKRGITRICKNMEFTNTNIALRCKNILNNEIGVIGYTLKETNNTLDNVIYNKFTIEELKEYKHKYLQLSIDKQINKDKKFIKINNIHIIYKRYLLRNLDKYNINNIEELKHNINFNNLTRNILHHMICEEYEGFNLLYKSDKLDEIIYKLDDLILNYSFVLQEEIEKNRGNFLG